MVTIGKLCLISPYQYARNCALLNERNKMLFGLSEKNHFTHLSKLEQITGNWRKCVAIETNEWYTVTARGYRNAIM